MFLEPLKEKRHMIKKQYLKKQYFLKLTKENQPSEFKRLYKPQERLFLKKKMITRYTTVKLLKTKDKESIL